MLYGGFARVLFRQLTQQRVEMEVLTIIGVIVLIFIIFTGGGILGWLLKGLGAIFEFLLEGWGSCLRVIVWIILIIMALLALAT